MFVLTLCEILNSICSSKTIFSQVCALVKTLLTVPVTTATAECSFSALRRLKTFLRSSMLQTTLNYVMLLHVHKEKTDELDLLQIANNFVSINDRRKKIIIIILIIAVMYILCIKSIVHKHRFVDEGAPLFQFPSSAYDMYTLLITMPFPIWYIHVYSI